MTVQVETVRTAELPTRIVHGPGSLVLLADLVAELGVTGSVCEFNAPTAPERYARVAQALGVNVHRSDPLDAAMAGVEELYRVTDDVGIPTMEELGYSEEEIRMLARIAYEDPQTYGNAREVDEAAYVEIYRSAFSRGPLQ